ncbi:hypothetical protein [Pseudonocardia pini]|uniref:hypothetical protein n=1 Tax=Pseudonocardia pini TaxID=2758030 RepID=UPI0015F11ECB|nr:hypothetical protein [Pseudonocardia pini]
MATKTPSAEALATAATRLAGQEQLPRELRLPLAHVLREAGAGLRRGMPLPIRLHAAFGELLVGIDDFAAGPVDPIEYP